MGMRRLVLALLFPLVLASPAAARVGGQQDAGDKSRLGMGPLSTGGVIAPLAGLFDGRSSGIDQRVEGEPDGSGDLRARLVSTATIGDNARIGLGLLRITRESFRERPIARAHPIRDVGPRGRTIAAVGLSISF